MAHTSAGHERDRLHRHEGRVLEEISRRMVQLHKECYGKGPTKARTYWEEDVITVLLRGGFTEDERTLREAGRGQAVLEHRMQFQEAMRKRFKDEVERLTGHGVIGFMSGAQVEEPEMAVQVFVLERGAGSNDGHAAVR